MKLLVLLMSLALIGASEAHTLLKNMLWDFEGISSVTACGTLELPDDFPPGVNSEDGFKTLQVDYFCEKLCEFVHRRHTGHHSYGNFEIKKFTHSPGENITALKCVALSTSIYVTKNGNKFKVYTTLVDNDPLIRQAPKIPNFSDLRV